MSIKKNNTYFKENDGKVYYFDENGIKKEIPSTAFSNLQEQIDNLGSPLTYSGAKSVDELNELEEIKQGTVYTVTGVSGILTAGNVEVKQGDEVAFATPNWVEIGKDFENSWKQWSEEHASTGTEDAVYIGKNNTANKDAYVIGINNKAEGSAFSIGIDNIASGEEEYKPQNGVFPSNTIGYKNSADLGATIIGRQNSASRGALVIGNESIGDTGATVIGKSSYGKLGFKSIGEANEGSQGGGAFGNSNIAGKGGYIVGDNNLSYRWDSNTSSYKTFVIQKNTNWENYATQYVFGYNNSINDGYGPILNGVTPLQIGCNNIIQDHIKYNDVDYYHSNSCSPFGNINLGRNNSAVNHGINLGANNLILTGDGSVAASINIGKYLVNRYGVLIGQNIESYGYGFGIGSNISGVGYGDILIGFGIRPQKDSRYSSRIILGNGITGEYYNNANVFGTYITAYSGKIPNRAEWDRTYGVHSDAIIIGSHIKGGVGAGSLLIGQNASIDAACASPYDYSVVPVVVTGDSMVFGGYTHDYQQSAYYRNPGISAAYNGIILGQGQQMSSCYDSIIIGNQSIAQYGSKVFGSHGYANNASLVLNPSPMTFQSQTVTAYFINGTIVNSAPEIYGSYTAEGVLKYVNGSLSAEKIKLSGDRIHEYYPKNYSIYYWSFFNKTNLTNENSSFAVFNITGNGWYNTERGYWNNDKTIFTPNTSYGENAIKINWTKGAYLLRIEDGVKKIYEYNEETSGTVDFPKYCINDSYYYYNPSDYKNVTPNSLKANNIMSDGKFIYKMPGYYGYGGYKTWSYVTAYIPTSFSGSQGYSASATYYYSNGKVYTYPTDVTAYGYKGQSGSIISGTSSVYPSAIYDVSSMVTNTTATYGSIAIGQKNSANNGSIAINTQSYSSNGGCSTAQHSITYNTNSSDNVWNYSFNENATTISPTWENLILNSFRSAGFIQSGDAQNIATQESISIGIGTKGGWENSANEHSMTIGSRSTASYNSFAIGKKASAYEHSVAIGFMNETSQYSNLGPTATYHSFALGSNKLSADNFSYAIGFDNIVAQNESFVIGHAGAFAYNNGIAIGSNGITARNQGIAIGHFGVYAENIDSYGDNGWGIAIGSQGITSTNGGIVFGYKGVFSNNTACVAIGSHGVTANESPSVAIGHLGTYAYNSISIGCKGGARNQSINLSISTPSYGSYTTGENGSILLQSTVHNCPAKSTDKSILINAASGGYAESLEGSIIIRSNTDGRFYTTADNQSIIFATRGYSGPDYNSLYSYNNSLIIGAGLRDTTATNDSISIGGGKIIDDNNLSQQIYNGSVAIGHSNTANGGVYVIGEKNYLGTTYTTFENRPIDYTQSFVIGYANTAENHRPYIWANRSAWSGDKYISAYISTDTNKTPHGYGSATYTRNVIIGSYNAVTGYNSFVFGINNTAGIPEYRYNQSTDKISGDKNDDGFTLAFGLNNRAVRNYDMAIGYGSIASGGENIAIGTPQTDEYGYYPTATQAIGYKNIAIRSNITGIGNIAINTHFAGNIMGIFDTGNYRYKINDNNKFYNSMLQFNASDENYWYISNNIINNANLTADLNNYFVYNNVTDLQSGYFSGSLTHNDFIHNNNLTVKTSYTTDGVESNLFYNTDSLSAEVDECSHNIFSHIIGNIVAQQSHNNMLFNSTINVSADKDIWRGFSNNFAQNSTITGVFQGLGDCFIFDSTAYFNNSSWAANNANVLFYSRYITNTADYALPQDSVIGYSVKEGEGQNFLFGTMGINLHSVFSFSDKFDLSATPSTLPRQEPYLMNCCRVYNFGDNTMINAANIDCAGEDNFIQGIKVANINGNYNFVVTDYVGDNSDFIGIYGQSNTYLASGTNNTTIGYNTIIGSNNNINVTNSGDNYNSSTVRNIIIGSENSYHSVKTSSFGNYTNLVNFYKNNENNIGSYYESSLPAGDRTIGFPLQFANRNTIVGQHSVISDAINDSIIVGSNNLIYNTTYETKGNNFASTDVISNNFTLGSYNLLKDGSNQINIGVGNNTSGFNATAIGEGLIAKTSQIVVGRFNEELDGTNGLSADDIDSTSGALFVVGNGKHIVNDYETSAVVRSNAMIVSADGTVSAKRFIEADPALTITGGNYVSVTEDTTNNKLVIDLKSSLGQMLTELSGVLTAKPSTGRHILGVDNGSLTWLEVNQ